MEEKEQIEVSLYYTSPTPFGEVRVYYVASPSVSFFVATLREGENFEQSWGIDSFSPQTALEQAAATWERSRPRAQGNPFKGALAELLELEGPPPQLIPL